MSYMDKHKKRVLEALLHYKSKRGNWVEVVMELAVALHEAKQECIAKSIAFLSWCTEIGVVTESFSYATVSVLTSMADYPEITREVLASTNRRCLQLIWKLEVKPLSIKPRPPAERKPNELCEGEEFVIAWGHQLWPIHNAAYTFGELCVMYWAWDFMLNNFPSWNPGSSALQARQISRHLRPTFSTAGFGNALCAIADAYGAPANDKCKFPMRPINYLYD